MAVEHNGILGELSSGVLGLLFPRLERVDLDARTLLYDEGSEATHFFFIESGIVSLLKSMRDGRTVELYSVGFEGMVPPHAVFGVQHAILRAMMLTAGSAWRLRRADLLTSMAEFPDLLRLVERYVFSAQRSIAQIAACNALHSVEQRCCRWLLSARDRLLDQEIHITHEQLAEMLGVRRTRISAIAAALQERRLIRYRHGRVTILDAASLRTSACECYAELCAIRSS